MKKESIKVNRCRFVNHLTDEISSISDSRKYLAVARINTIELYRKANTMTLEKTIHTHQLEKILFINNRLFSASLEGEIIEYSTQSLQQIFKTDSYGGAVWSMDVNSTGKILAVGCEDGSVRLFNVLDIGLEYISMLERHTTKVLSIKWHPSDAFIVVAGDDGSIRIIDIDLKRTIQVIKLAADVVVWDLLLLPMKYSGSTNHDGVIVSGDSKGCVSFWDFENGTLIKQIQAHDADVLCLAGSKDGSKVFSSGVDAKIVEMSLLIPTSSNQNPKKSKLPKWVISGKKKYHSHDVRAMLYLEDKPWDSLITGGVDISLTMSSPIQNFEKSKVFTN